MGDDVRVLAAGLGLAAVFALAANPAFVDDAARTILPAEAQAAIEHGAAAVLPPGGVSGLLARLQLRVDQTQEQLSRQGGEIASLRKEVARVRQGQAAAVQPVQHVAEVVIRPEPPRGRPLHGWLLRGATPDVAYLSPSEADLTAPLKRVVPGDRVAGLGKVVAVRQTTKGWALETDRGYLLAMGAAGAG